MFNLFKKIIFLECDLAKRDAKIYLTIAKWIEDQTEFKVFLVGRNSRRYFDLNYRDCLFFLTPQHYFLKNNSSNIRSIIETEGLLNRKLIHLTFLKNKIKKNSKIFVWGKNTKNSLVNKLSIQPSKIEIIGTPRFRALKRKSKKKGVTIGIICRNVSLSNFKNVSKIQMLFNSFGDKQKEYFYPFLFEKQILKDVKSCNLIFEMIKEFKNERSFNISIRPHPNENPKDYFFLEKKYKNVQINYNTDFKDWIKGVDTVVTPGSSTIIDVIKAEIPIFFTGEGYADETFYNLTKKVSYSLKERNNKEFIKKKITEFYKMKRKSNNSILKKFFKNYLNNDIFNLLKITNYVKINSVNCKKKFIPKIIIIMLYHDIKFLFKKILNKRNEGFDYIYSQFFSGYKHDMSLFKRIKQFNGVVDFKKVNE